MDVAIVTVGVVLLGVIVWLASRRLRSPLANAARPLGEREALEAERRSVLTALQDLEAERVAGALTPEDFAEQRVALMTRGADALRRLDALSPAPVVDTDAAALPECSARSRDRGPTQARAGDEWRAAHQRRRGTCRRSAR